MQIQISWLLQKPTDLDLHCLQRQGISGFSRTRVNLHHSMGKCLISMKSIKITIFTLSIWTPQLLTVVSLEFEQGQVTTHVVSKNCWISGKLCRPWWDAAFCGISSGSTLFAQAWLSKYIPWIWYAILDFRPAQWLSGRASALWPGGCGFDPRPGHTKDFKNGTSCSFAWHSALRK